MKNVAWYGGALALAFALLLTFGGSMIGGTGLSAVASAQEATIVPTVGLQESPAQLAQPSQPNQQVDDNNNDFPWGLLGLIGLAGLAGLSRPEPVRHEPIRNPSTTGVYENKN